jgi:hypothetical protein
MALRRTLGPLLAALAALPACDFKFDGQTIRMVADQEQDRLDLLLVYHGLSVAKNRLKDQIEILDFILVSKTVMVFDSFPLAFSLEDPELLPIAKHLQVEQGPMFLDEKGRLSMFQMVRVSDVRGLLALANDAIRNEITEVLDKEQAFLHARPDQQTQELLRAAIRDRHGFVEKRGTALVFILPCSATFHSGFRRHLLQSLIEEVVREVVKVPEDGKPAAPATVESVMDQPALRLVLDNEWSISRVGDRTHVTLGIPGSSQGTLVKPPQGKYEPGLLEALGKAGRGAVAALGQDAIERRFAEFVRAGSRPAGAASRPAR